MAETQDSAEPLQSAKGAKVSIWLPYSLNSSHSLPVLRGGGWAHLLTGLGLAYLVGSECVLLAARVSWVSRVSREAIRCMDRGCRG